MKSVTTKHINVMVGALVGIIFSIPVYAEDMPVIQVNMLSDIQSGHVTDGQRLGLGAIVFHEIHSEFQIWSDGLRSGVLPGQYVLVGSNNPDHKLQVRLEGDNWQPDNKNGKGIMLYSQDDIGRFYIVADGEQSVAADRYTLQIRGATVTPD